MADGITPRDFGIKEDDVYFNFGKFFISEVINGQTAYFYYLNQPINYIDVTFSVDSTLSKDDEAINGMFYDGYDYSSHVSENDEK